VLSSIKTVSGSVAVNGTGDIEARTIVTRPGRGTVTINSVNGDLTVGTDRVEWRLHRRHKDGQDQPDSPAPSCTPAKTQPARQAGRPLLDRFGRPVAGEREARATWRSTIRTAGLFTVHQAYILDGNFTVTTRGDMLVKDVRVRSNTGNHSVSLNAGGNLTFGLINAGDYAVTPDHALADITWEALGLLGPAYRRRVDVSLTAGGSILKRRPADPSVDLIADQVTLSAGGSIGASNSPRTTCTVVKSGAGGVNWTPMDRHRAVQLPSGRHHRSTMRKLEPLTLTKVFIGAMARCT
jgi:hypothetical protein